MQYEVRGKGNMNVEAMGGQRGVRRSKDRQNLLRVLAVSHSKVCESLGASTAERNQPCKQTYRATAQEAAVMCVLSHPQAADPLSSQHTALWDLGQGTPQPAHSALGEAWIRNFKHL